MLNTLLKVLGRTPAGLGGTSSPPKGKIDIILTSEGVRSSALDMFYFKESTFDFLMEKISKTIFVEKIDRFLEIEQTILFSYWKIDFLK